jgi:hypothetical protein
MSDIERLESIRWYWKESGEPRSLGDPDIVFLLRQIDTRDTEIKTL